MAHDWGMSTTEPEPGWQAIFEAEFLEEGAPQRVVVEGLPPLAVFKLADGCFVTADTCTHGEASLCEGFVEGDEIECPWHSGRFSIRTGEPTAMPACDPIRAYKTRVIAGQVCIETTPGGR